MHIAAPLSLGKPQGSVFRLFPDLAECLPWWLAHVNIKERQTEVCSIACQELQNS